MTYKETLDFLFTQFPVFQNSGQSAYKPGLENALTLADMMGNPHRGLKCIHVAGTNGKGSAAHTLAAILQQSGYRTGLFTSPHLLDFRERIRVNGEMITEEAVVDFTARYLALEQHCRPSFFELTTMMAFEWFQKQRVDFAVIEAGLGGRLDTTNIITPILSVITNISLDHTALLGSTPEAIAYEKAGIIKRGVPVVVGNARGAVREVFENKACKEDAPIVFASDHFMWKGLKRMSDGRWFYEATPFGNIVGELRGAYQPENASTAMNAVIILRKVGLRIPDNAVSEGFAHVEEITGLMGRWMKVAERPLTICDTGHNVGGWEYLWQQLNDFDGKKHIVIGFVSDKDVSRILWLMSAITNAKFYFAQASVERALPSESLREKAVEAGIAGAAFNSVGEAYKKALAEAGEGDMIFVGGSTFVVADFLSLDEISAQR